MMWRLFVRRSRATMAMVVPCVLAVLVALCASPSAAAPAPARDSITAHGPAADHGPSGGQDLAAVLVDLAGTSSGDGYWAVAADGGVFAHGGAPFHGSAGGMALHEPVVAIAAAPAATGYWLLAADGGVFSYGATQFHGSMGGTVLNESVVGGTSTPSGDGYWLVAADGGVFAFGDAGFHGSMGGRTLNHAIVGMASTATGDGYWLVGADGGVFSFGDATFLGSTGGRQLERPVVDMATSVDGAGYWLATQDGHVFAFGVPEEPTPAELDGFDFTHTPVTAIAASADGGYWIAYGRPLLLEVEDEGPAVADLQRRLEALGYWVGPIDGIFGELTQQALYAFQKHEGLAVDGIYGAATRAALADARPPQARSTSGDVAEVDKTRQLLFVVRDGETAWTFNAATGDEVPYTYGGQTYDAETPTGSFTVFRQIDDWRVSHLGRLYRPKYFTFTGIAIHGYTFVPPYPASHGCVRVSIAAMDHLWAADLMPIGTEVLVYGTLPG